MVVGRDWRERTDIDAVEHALRRRVAVVVVVVVVNNMRNININSRTYGMCDNLRR